MNCCRGECFRCARVATEVVPRWDASSKAAQINTTSPALSRLVSFCVSQADLFKWGKYPLLSPYLRIKMELNQIQWYHQIFLIVKNCNVAVTSECSIICVTLLFCHFRYCRHLVIFLDFLSPHLVETHSQRLILIFIWKFPESCSQK